ncbi:MAG: sulfatase-like hydrolase/transferase, partial [Deltaproteobacteria bacterium]|nr:sulfatase-like hydrolase/transferase [Deltaproteobacteria bacterium]
ARGMRERTLIVVTADHGELLGERGERGHNGKAYEEVLHVPWVLRLPGYLPAGSVMEWPASLVDVTPTLLAFLGVPAPDKLEGAVLPLPVPGLVERKLPDRAIVARTETWDEELHLAAVEGDFKSMESRLVPSGDILAAPALFDLAKDPYELHDLASAEPGRLARLREALKPMLVTVEGQGPVDEQTKGVLRALGYVQ